MFHCSVGDTKALTADHKDHDRMGSHAQRRGRAPVEELSGTDISAKVADIGSLIGGGSRYPCL